MKIEDCGFMKIEDEKNIGYYDCSQFPLNYCGVIIIDKENGNIRTNINETYYDMDKLNKAIEEKARVYKKGMK